MRSAIFGGTFDPIHNAHLAMAREAGRADFVWTASFWFPRPIPRIRPASPTAPYEDRVRMAELACQDDPRLEVSRLEEGTVRSYSIDTIEKVRSGMAARG